MRGIPVGVDWSWFLVLFLVIWLLSGFYGDLLGSPEDSIEPYALAVISALGFFGSILLHELGHALVALRNKHRDHRDHALDVRRHRGAEDATPTRAGVEFRIAAAGPGRDARDRGRLPAAPGR